MTSYGSSGLAHGPASRGRSSHCRNGTLPGQAPHRTGQATNPRQHRAPGQAREGHLTDPPPPGTVRRTDGAYRSGSCDGPGPGAPSPPARSCGPRSPPQPPRRLPESPCPRTHRPYGRTAPPPRLATAQGHARQSPASPMDAASNCGPSSGRPHQSGRLRRGSPAGSGPAHPS